MNIQEYKHTVLATLRARKQTFYNNGAKKNGRIAANLIAAIEDIQIPAQINIGNLVPGADQTTYDESSLASDTRAPTSEMLEASESPSNVQDVRQLLLLRCVPAI